MLLTIIAFIVILSLLVFVHEMGHFLTARKFGVKAPEFGFGLPPRIVGFQRCSKKELVKIGETENLSVDVATTQINGQEVLQETIINEKKEIDQLVTKKSWRIIWGGRELTPEETNDPNAGTVYSLNWIPVGGFVNLKGENGDNKEDRDSFGSKKLWQRAIILSAGVTMNVVLCAICLMFVFGLGAPQALDEVAGRADIKDAKVQVVEVIADSPAAKAGISMGDVLKTIDGQEYSKIEDIQTYMASHDGQSVQVVVDRFGESKSFDLTPTFLKDTGKAAAGFAIINTGIVSYPWYEAIWLGIRGTYIMFIQIIVAFYTIIKNLLFGLPAGVEVAGPIGIAVLTGKVARMGFVYILQFTALLSLNLAIINFLPFPALDGGRVFFLLIEKLRGKAMNQKIEQVIHTAGFLLLLLLIFVVTSRDLWNMRGFFSGIFHKIVN